MNQYKKRKQAIQKSLREHADAWQDILKKSREENDGELTEEEREQIVEHTKAIDTLKAELAEVEKNIETLSQVDEAVRDLGGGVDLGDRGIDAIEEVKSYEYKSIGEMFVESDAYKSIQDPADRGSQFSSGQVEVPFSTKGTLLTGAGSPGSGSGGGLLPVPQVVPGVVQKLFARNIFSDLLGSGQVNSNTIRYTVEGTATNSAAGVAEAGPKPESTLGLSTTDEPVKKLATLLPVSEETLEDAAQVEAYINSRLTTFIQNVEDLQLIRGTGTNDLQGIIGRSGVNIYTGGTAAGNKAEQIFKAINGVRGSAFTDPEWIVVNPSDYQDLRLLKDTAGQFFGGGPWMGPYGNSGQQVSSNGLVTGAPEALWGKQVYVSANIGVGTALAGNSRDAIVWRKGGIRVDASNSHSTYFANNLVAIRAEERLALAVYRPSSFVEIRLA